MRFPLHIIAGISLLSALIAGCGNVSANHKEPPEITDNAEIQAANDETPDDAAKPENGEIADNAADHVEPTDDVVPETAVNTGNDGCPAITSLDPLCEKQRAILDEIKQDADPEVLFAVHQETIGRHYLVSDEKHPDLFRPSIENKGGTYIGVGFEQGYLYIGWQRPTLAFLIDYDPWVVLNHRVLVEVAKKCETAQCLHDHFLKRDVAEAFLKSPEAAAAGFTTKDAMHRIQRLRYAVSQALTKLRGAEYPTFMNTPEIYDYVRGMILSGRLRVVQANLLDSVGMNSIADAMKQLGAELQTLYLSNAEQYWSYPDQFKTNMLSLPFAENGIVMRTRATYPRNSDYRYSIQPANIFRIWMARDKTRAVKPMTKHVSIRRPDQFPFVVDDLMPE